MSFTFTLHEQVPMTVSIGERTDGVPATGYNNTYSA